MSLIVNLTSQRSRDVIGRMSVTRDVIAVKTVKSYWCVLIRFLSIKSPRGSIVCLFR